MKQQKTALSSLIFYFGVLTVPIVVLIVVLTVGVVLSVAFSG